MIRLGLGLGQEETRLALDHMVDLQGLMAMGWVINPRWQIEHPKHGVLTLVHDAVSEFYQSGILAAGVCEAWIPGSTSKVLWHHPFWRSSLLDRLHPRFQHHQQFPAKQLHGRILRLQPEMCRALQGAGHLIRCHDLQLRQQPGDTTWIHHTFRPQGEEWLIPRLKAIDVAWKVQVSVTRSHWNRLHFLRIFGKVPPLSTEPMM
mmetsp:Transcript_41198/g.65320  ORF Transcript_41198/g.65320 Transcript_41198/m.65320 type:complete len:204 (+) Transcript_41198:390-1001(+)